MPINTIICNDTTSFAKKLIKEILDNGTNNKREVGEWCLKRKGSENILELNAMQMILRYPKNCITSQHTLSCEIETEDYLLGLNPGYVEYSDWEFYKKFKVNDKYPYTYGERLKTPLKSLAQSIIDDKTSRRLVISMWNNESDIFNTFVPCNIAMKFDISKGKLNMFIINRSQDVCRGLFLDTFAYPFIQQVLANNFGLKLGWYYHYIMNAHIYESDMAFAQRILDDIRKVDDIHSQSGINVTEKLDEKTAETLKEISNCIFIKHKIQEAHFIAKKLPDFWYHWKENQILYAYSKYIKKETIPTAITCAGVVINENPGNL